jgi:hypothetical protein
MPVLGTQVDVISGMCNMTTAEIEDAASCSRNLAPKDGT